MEFGGGVRVLKRFKTVKFKELEVSGLGLSIQEPIP